MLEVHGPVRVTLLPPKNRPERMSPTEEIPAGCLFFIELSTRKVEIAGIASTATGLWMSPIARNLTGANGGS